MLAPGDVAPDFEALNRDGTPFKLSELKGHPVVLYFYPKADTPGCTVEAKEFEKHLPAFRARDVRVVGVSVDDCPDQQAFARKYGLSFPLIADTAKAIARAYGVLAPEGRARRVSFFLDGQGKVLEIVQGVPPDVHVARARSRYLGG